MTTHLGVRTGLAAASKGKEIAMRHRVLVLALLLGMTVALGGCAATSYNESSEPAEYDADYGYFYDALSPYGAWYQVAPYGWVWTPYDVPVGWRPYTDGRWVYTAYGWTWLSDDTWGWAPYHYGRWTWDRYYGWLWVPGNVWAPAWVAWRYGDGWIGWAPLPPEVGWNGAGLEYGSYDVDRDLSRYRWSFCSEKDFTTTRVRTVVVPRSRNVTLLRATRDVTRYESLDARPAERGFTSDMLERDLKRKIPRYDVSDAPGVGRDRAAVVRGDVLEMYRPKIRDRAPTVDRTPPNARNRTGEEQRLEERNKARTEAQRQRTATDASQKERSEIQPPGGRMEQPNVQAPAPTTKPKPESKPAPGTKPEQPTPPDATSQAEAQRHAAEQKDLDARIQAQRQELKQEQQKDLKTPPPGISRKELQKQHEEEKKAQAEDEKRDREELKNREELRRQWAEQQAREQARREEEQKSQDQKDGKRQKSDQQPEDGGKQQQDQGQNRNRSRQR